MKKIFSPRFLLTTVVLAGGLAVPAFANNYSSDYSQNESGKWAGPYAGVHFGTTWADMQHDGGTLGPHGDNNTLMGGGQAGFNWQADRWVYGAEGDFSKLDADSKSPNVTFDEDWMMTFRGRAGYAFGKFLPYGTFGVALTDTYSKIPGVGSNSGLQPGIAAGAGVDMMASDKWMWRVEYLYTDVPTDSSNIGGTTVSGGSQNSTIRMGLNYKF